MPVSATASSKIFYILAICSLAFVAAKEKAPNKRDMKHIACDVCERSVSQVVERVQLTSRWATFDEIDRIFSNACDIVKTDSWIRQLDIVTHDSNRTVGLVSGNGVSACGTECLTIRKKCTNLLDEDIDRERVVDYIKSKHSKATSELSFEDVKSKVCNEWNKVCPNKMVLAAGEERHDDAFIAIDPSALQKERDQQYQDARNFAEKKGITAIFTVAEDMVKVRAKLYWNDKFIGDLKDNLTPQRHQTYMGHVWTVKINGKVVKTWGIGIEPVQYYTLTWGDVHSPDL